MRNLIILFLSLTVLSGCATMTTQERAEFAERYQAMREMQAQRQPQGFQPMRMYQAPRTQKTQCRSRYVGNQIQTDCESQPTGLDSGIFNQ